MHALDEGYALEVERTATCLTIRYAKVDDSVTRLRELVAAATAFCSFVARRIDEDHADLRLILTGPGRGGPGRVWMSA